VNTSPEPLSNWFLSLGEDLFVVGLGYLALRYPIGALVVTAILIGLIVAFASAILRTTRHWFSKSGRTTPRSQAPHPDR